MVVGEEKLLSKAIFVFFYMYMQLALLLNQKYRFDSDLKYLSSIQVRNSYFRYEEMKITLENRAEV